MAYLKISNVPLYNKRVLVRSDLNVPMEKGVITDDTRIRASLPTFQFALEKEAKQIMILSHLGRPKEGHWQSEFSLEPAAHRIQELLQHPVSFVKDWLDGTPLPSSRILVFENVRFQKGETENDETLARKIASLCDIFVMDAFGAAHRAHASTHGTAKFAAKTCAGLLLTQELEALQKVLENPRRPLVAIVGGSKVSSKLGILEFLLDKVDILILGGGIANTFLKACGKPIGQSLFEPNLVEIAQKILENAKLKNVKVLLPEDVKTSKELSQDVKASCKSSDQVEEAEKIFDVGPATRNQYAQVIAEAGTILWNGPVGVFEYGPFAEGTRALAIAISESPAFSVAGGGDTIAAIEQFQVTEGVDFISTGGGAFLEFIAGKTLPGVAVLEERFKKTERKSPHPPFDKGGY